MSSKCLIFFLNVAVDAAAVLPPRAFASPENAAVATQSVRKKKAGPRSSSRASQAGLPIRLVWQVIRSQGQGAMMNTSAETFSADGVLIPVGRSSWELRAKNSSIYGYFVSPKLGMDGRLILQRGELLDLLGVTSWRGGSIDGSGDGSDSSQVLQLPLLKAPNRQMETIYRGPEEELLLVKVSITTST